MAQQWNHKIFGVKKDDFDALALEIFHFQYAHNTVYKEYTDALGIQPEKVKGIEQIPFLPIRFFKSHNIGSVPELSTENQPARQAAFESSGTTTTTTSQHVVHDLSIYEESFMTAFELFYGNIEEYSVFALLPSYLERGNSSLVYMVDHLIRASKNEYSRFYLDNTDEMITKLKEREKLLGEEQVITKKNLLIGVTYALLDLVEHHHLSLQHTIVMETGGMKGRRKEMIREELHNKLISRLGVKTIHSEYGMTELLSQAYSTGHGRFYCPPWMKIMARDEEDPLVTRKSGTGVINVIDLANVYSCSFIATDDAVKICEDESFEILGRIDNSDIRGCSLLVYNE